MKKFWVEKLSLHFWTCLPKQTKSHLSMLPGTYVVTILKIKVSPFVVFYKIKNLKPENIKWHLKLKYQDLTAIPWNKKTELFVNHDCLKIANRETNLLNLRHLTWTHGNNTSLTILKPSHFNPYFVMPSSWRTNINRRKACERKPQKHSVLIQNKTNWLELSNVMTLCKL